MQQIVFVVEIEGGGGGRNQIICWDRGVLILPPRSRGLNECGETRAISGMVMHALGEHGERWRSQLQRENSVKRFASYFIQTYIDYQRLWVLK